MFRRIRQHGTFVLRLTNSSLINTRQHPVAPTVRTQLDMAYRCMKMATCCHLRGTCGLSAAPAGSGGDAEANLDKKTQLSKMTESGPLWWMGICISTPCSWENWIWHILEKPNTYMTMPLLKASPKRGSRLLPCICSICFFQGSTTDVWISCQGLISSYLTSAWIMQSPAFGSLRGVSILTVIPVGIALWPSDRLQHAFNLFRVFSVQFTEFRQ